MHLQHNKNRFLALISKFWRFIGPDSFSWTSPIFSINVYREYYIYINIPIVDVEQLSSELYVQHVSNKLFFSSACRYIEILYASSLSTPGEENNIKADNVSQGQTIQHLSSQRQGQTNTQSRHKICNFFESSRRKINLGKVQYQPNAITSDTNP